MLPGLLGCLLALLCSLGNSISFYLRITTVISVTKMLSAFLGLLGLVRRHSDISSSVIIIRFYPRPDVIVIPWCDKRCLFVIQLCASLSPWFLGSGLLHLSGFLGFVGYKGY